MIDAKTNKLAWDEKFAADVSDLVDQAKLYRDQLSADRNRAMLYENGDMTADMPSKTGWSQVVSTDVRATMKKVFPSLTRTILGNEIIVEFNPQKEDDEAGAEQSTEFINFVSLPESNGHKAISDAMHDACLLRNGILYTGIEDKITVTGSEHRGLDEFALAELLEDPDTELVEGRAYEAPPEETPEQPSPRTATASPDPEEAAPLQDPALNPQEIMPPQPGMPAPGMPPAPVVEEPAMLYDVKIKRVVKKPKPVLLGVPPEEFLIHPDATDAQVDSPIVGREMRMSRSDLIAMGYDKKLVDALPAESYTDSDSEKFTRRNRAWMQSSPDQKELEMVLYYDLYVRLDYDNDGIAELRHVCCAGDVTKQHIVVNEYADFIRYHDIVIERRPHRWEGVSIADDVIEIQKVKTALLRYAMDNTYNVVSPQKAVNIKALANPNNLDAIMNPEPGRPIFLSSSDANFKAENAVSYDVQPYVADKAMVAVQYWDKQIVDRTGIDDSSAGLPPDALQNVTAKASAMIEQKGIAQTELMVATIANCLKPVFSAFLKLTIQCNDKPRTVRLRDKFVQIDPRTWDANMDVNINTGLGAGTRERDMMVMQMITGMQDRLFTALGGLSPILKADNIYAAVEKTVQAAGIKSVGKFFTKPDPAEVAAAEKAKAEQPSPEMEKVNAQIKLLGEQSKANAAKEQAQAQADIIVTNAKARADMMISEAEKTKNEALEFRQQMLDRYKIDEANKLGRQQIASNERIARHKNKLELEKAQAGDLSKTVLGIKEDNEKPAKDAGPRLAEIIAELTEGIKKMSMPKKFKRNEKTGDIEGMEITEEEKAA